MKCRKAFQVIRNFSSQKSVLSLLHYKVDLVSALAFLHICGQTLMTYAFLFRTYTRFSNLFVWVELKWISCLLYYMKENLLSNLLGVKELTSFSKLLSSWPLNTKFAMNVRIQILQELLFRSEIVIGTDYPHHRLCCCLLE
jgi:hypothetical protein